MGKVELGGPLRGSVLGRGNTNFGIEAEKHRNMILLRGEDCVALLTDRSESGSALETQS